MLGNMLPTSDNPVRLAEEIAMLDVISGGRIISGFVRGIGIESWANNTNPLHNRERFEECHDLVVKTWTTPGPFRWEGTHYHYRAVNPWMLPIQKPHPPVWVPGTGSPETVEWTARHRYTYAAFLTPLDVAKNLFARYREYAAADGWEPGPEKFAFMICCHVNDTDEKAQESGKAFLWRMNYPLRGPREYWSPPGYTSRAGAAAVAARRPTPLHELSYEELQERYHLVVGSPETVIKKLKHIRDELGVGSLLLEAQGARLLVLDPLAAAYAADENARGLVRAFVSDWDAWARANDCAVLILAHPPKSGADYAGSTDWQGSVRALWTLSQETIGLPPARGQPDCRTKVWTLDAVKGNYGAAPDPVQLAWDHTGGGLRWQINATIREVSHGRFD